MPDVELLNWVFEMTQMQMQREPFAKVDEIATKLFAAARHETSKPEASRDTEADEICEKKDSSPQPPSPPKDRQKPTFEEAAREIVAPVPGCPESDGTYDPLIIAKLLPSWNQLPIVFGGTEYSVVRLNEYTVAMSFDHYYDLLSLRDECERLRKDKSQLETVLLEAGRRHVAIEQLAKRYVSISRNQDDMFSVNVGAGATCSKSLTEAMERAVIIESAVDSVDAQLDAITQRCNPSRTLHAVKPEFESVMELTEATIDDVDFLAELQEDMLKRPFPDVQPSAECQQTPEQVEPENAIEMPF